MRSLKYAFVAALALMFPAQVQAGDGGYLQAAWSMAAMDDVSASYRGTTETYALDDGDSYNATLGYGFMKNFAMELKVNYVVGDVDTIGGAVTRAGSTYDYAAATLGLLYRADRIEMDKGSQFALVPYVGLGFGYDGGYMDVQKDSESNCGQGDSTNTDDNRVGTCASGDNRGDWGGAMRGSIGGVFELHENLGIDLNYDYIWGSQNDNHFGSAGIRLMF